MARDLHRPIGISFLGLAVARLIGATAGVLAARALGPDGRGQLALFVVLGTAGATAAAAGLPFWIASEVARTGSVRAGVVMLRRHGRLLLAGLPLAAFVVWACAGGALGSPATFAGTVALALAGAFNMLRLAVSQGMGAMGVVAAAFVASSVVYLAVTAVVITTGSATPAALLWGAVAGQTASATVARMLAGRSRVPDVPAGAVPPASYREALALGVPAGASELALLAMLRLDVVLVAAYLPLASVGLYAVATALTEMLWVIADAVAIVALPATARAPQRRTLLVVGLAAMGVAGALLVVVAGPVIPFLFGPEFAGATVAVPFLVAAAVAGGAWKILAAEAVARGRSRPRLASALAGLGAMVVIDLAAIPALGLVGAALGSASGYAVAASVLWVSGVRGR